MKENKCDRCHAGLFMGNDKSMLYKGRLITLCNTCFTRMDTAISQVMEDFMKENDDV